MSGDKISYSNAGRFDTYSIAQSASGTLPIESRIEVAHERNEAAALCGTTHYCAPGMLLAAIRETEIEHAGYIPAEPEFTLSIVNGVPSVNIDAKIDPRSPRIMSTVLLFRDAALA